ncbi:MAG: MlaE family lipid ABC transporter permease subunit [Alphaproteobacteria bacterium]|nr:MlaE family lipid ABC transporter permease subunit [Alphaproteobacteria bacterium]
MAPSTTSFQVKDSADGKQVLAVIGDWTIWTIGAIDPALRNIRLPGDTPLDVSELGSIDTSGAYMIDRTLGGAGVGPEAKITLVGDHPTVERLVVEVRGSLRNAHPEPVHHPGIIALLDRAGRGAIEAWTEFAGLLSFIGEAMTTLAGLLLRPQKIRWTSVVAVMEEAGLDALPIVSFLSFFIGLVIAFLGANLLAQFGAALFVVELVAFAMLREFGVVLTGILLAGRTDSAFTAQIGSMKMRQEIDAMKVMGLDPMEVLVAPRLIALVVMAPLLSFAATVSGIVGGMIAAWLAMDISPSMFLNRFQDVVLVQHFWTGLLKAPVIAIVVALIGCRQGLLVEGDVQSLGRHTTAAVVHAIFLVIAIDAAFAVIYYEMDL